MTGSGSTQDVASALDCQPTGSAQKHPDEGYTELTCTFRADGLAIYWMDSDQISFMGESWPNDELFGDGRWNVECESHAERVKMQSVIGGDLGRS